MKIEEFNFLQDPLSGFLPNYEGYTRKDRVMCIFFSFFFLPNYDIFNNIFITLL